MPEPGMGANNDHRASSYSGNDFGGGGDQHYGQISSSRATFQSPTSLENLLSRLSDIDAISSEPTTAESIANQPTTIAQLAQVSDTSDDDTPAGAIAGAAAQDTAIRTAPLPEGSRTYNTPDAAAFDTLSRGNRNSIQSNLEFGGLIYQDPANGRFAATSPISGTGTSFDPSAVSTPHGTKTVGDYHTHGDYSIENAKGDLERTTHPAQDHFNSDRFSQTDFDGIRFDAQGKPGYAGYLGTPSGEFRRFDPATGADTRMSVPNELISGSARSGAATGAVIAVSYTHLTLPTIYSV